MTVRRGRAEGGPPSGPSMAAMTVLGGLLGFLGANWWLYQQGNIGGLVVFDLLSLLAGGLGVFLWNRFGSKKGRAYMDEELVEAKLKSLAFWSELQIVRIFTNQADADDVRDNVDRLVDCLRSFDDPAGNAWDVGKMREYIGADLFQHRYLHHPFLSGSGVMEWVDTKKARRTALSAREVASLWHPPLGTDEMASMERTAVGVFTPYLADLTVVGEDSGPLVGMSVGEGHQIYLPESSLRKHTIILGKSGVGKSTMIKHVVAHKLERKAEGRDDGAIVVIDPHADLVRDILKMVPPSIAHKVRLLDFGREDRVPGINLVDPMLFPNRDRCVDTIINTVKHLWEHWGGRLEDLLKNSLMIIYEFNCHKDTPRDTMLTMLDILALLDDGDTVGQGRDARVQMSSFQSHVLSRVEDPRLKQWFQSYLNWPRDTRAEAVGPVHSRVGAYAKDQRASVIMGQRESTIHLTDVLQDGLILLVSTAQGTIGIGPAALMGGTMVSLVESALRDQESIDPSKRAKCLLICDEFQTVSGANWEGMLAEIRKYGCSLMLSTQSLARLDTPERKLKAGILGNVGCMVSYQMSAEDAHMMSAEMDAERIQDRDLVNLHPHYCVVRINSDSKCYPAFSMKTLPPPDDARGSDESVAAVLEASMAYTTDWAEARLKMNAEISNQLNFGKIGSDMVPDSAAVPAKGGGRSASAGKPVPDASGGPLEPGAGAPPPGDDPYTKAMEAIMSRTADDAKGPPSRGSGPAAAATDRAATDGAAAAAGEAAAEAGGAVTDGGPAVAAGAQRSPPRSSGPGGDDPLSRVDPMRVEQSPFTPELLAQIGARVNTDPALRDIVDRRLGSQITRERKKVRDEETQKIRTEAYQELESDFEALERARGDLDNAREEMRAEVAREEREKALAELSGNVDVPGSSRDISALKRPPARS